MDYPFPTEIAKNGNRIVVQHFFKGPEIQVGSRWQGSSDNIVTVEEVKILPQMPEGNGDIRDWYEIYYFWEEKGEKKTWNKDCFNFQVRYCLILE